MLMADSCFFVAGDVLVAKSKGLPPPLCGENVGPWATDDVDVSRSAGGCGRLGVLVGSSEPGLLLGWATMLVEDVVLEGDKVGVLALDTLGELLDVDVVEVGVTDIDRDGVTITVVSAPDPVPHRASTRPPFCARDSNEF
ncbi:hypothetical protein HRG_013759 [Hirsutella rhossiliensis]